ncbi:hypothetical protein [Georgenia wutianyii]|uniref:hypothetical protein n=1 Tax=Georgenia wutianyii TaxID=2585135 RepID=UPI00143D62C4|nr:hypothetical protein [Georgenia wutianyii]
MNTTVRRLGAGAAAALLTASLAVVAAPSALAKGGEVGGSGSEFHLSDTFSAQANTKFTYGRATDEVYVGDWDGNGTDTLALRRGATFHIRNSNSGGPADRVVTYGRPGDVVLVGDWDGDGKDTFAVRRGAVYHVKNSMSGGPADQQVVYGRAGDTVLVGDWNGDGKDTFAVRRGAEYHVKNSMTPGRADKVAVYGRAGDDVYVGDWNGDRRDTFAVRRGAQYFVANEIRPGNADRTVVYGRTTDTTLVGDWNGDGTDSLGIRRTPAPPAPVPVAFRDGTHRVGSGIKPGTYRASSGSLCYWERLSGFSGELDDIITNDFGGRTIVTIDASDAGFRSSNCGSWAAVGATYQSPLATGFQDGTYVVGGHIAPGTYRAPGGTSCYWERMSAFSGSFDDIITNDFGQSSPVVTIAPGDKGFYSNGCGTWTR